MRPLKLDRRPLPESETAVVAGVAVLVTVREPVGVLTVRGSKATLTVALCPAGRLSGRVDADTSVNWEGVMVNPVIETAPVPVLDRVMD